MSTDPIQPIELAKSALRQNARGRLAAMTDAEQRAESEAVCRRALVWPPMQHAGCVMAYWPMPREVDVRPLLSELLGRGTVVCVPRVDWATGRLAAVPIRDLGRDLGATERGVVQPRADLAPIADHDVQIVVVPGLAFDAAGGRIGHGAGFYDRWLAGAGSPPGGLVSLGAAFGCQMTERVPMEAHDRRLDAVATAGGVFTHERTDGPNGPTEG